MSGVRLTEAEALALMVETATEDATTWADGAYLASLDRPAEGEAIAEAFCAHLIQHTNELADYLELPREGRRDFVCGRVAVFQARMIGFAIQPAQQGRA